MGPVVSAAARQRIVELIDSGVAEGARLVVDGRTFDAAQAGAGCAAGFWLGGTLFDHVQPHMRIWREEIFGPVLACVRVATLADAVALIHRRAYGNGVPCFTRDGHTAREFARHIQVGMVGIHVPIPVPMAWHVFVRLEGQLFRRPARLRRGGGALLHTPKERDAALARKHAQGCVVRDADQRLNHRHRRTPRPTQPPQWLRLTQQKTRYPGVQAGRWFGCAGWI